MRAECLTLSLSLGVTSANIAISGVATGWTGVDMSTPLLPEAIPEIDANPITFLGGKWGGGSKCKRVSEVIRQSEQLINF